MTEKGTMTIKGNFEDVMLILLQNGYKVSLESEPESENFMMFQPSKQHYKLSYEKFDMNKLLDEQLAYTE